jgi:hypothetical protein
MEFASSYLPTEHDPCFYIGYHSTDRELVDKNHFGHQYGGFYCDYIYLSGIHLPIIKSHDYQFKYQALYLTLKYSDGWKSEEEYLTDIAGLAENLQVNKSWTPTEGLVCFEYTEQAIESLKRLYDFEIESMPEPPNEFSKEPLIFFLYQNSD